jgi:hypothetical protein
MNVFVDRTEERLASPRANPGAEEARAWVSRRLAWERRLGELRVRPAGCQPETDGPK